MAFQIDSFVPGESTRTPDGFIRKSSNLARVVKGGYAIADQGLFAAANFLLNIFLARWLTSVDYGRFSVAYALLLLLGSVHQGLIIEPMLVFGPGRYCRRLSRYFMYVIGLHLTFTIGIWCVAGIVLAVGNVFGLMSHLDGGLLFSMLVASASVFLLWVVRRSYYVTLHPGRAAAIGFLYLSFVITGLWAVHRFASLSPARGFLLTSAAALAAAAIGIIGWPLREAESRGLRAREFSSAAVRHWHYGKWALGSVPGIWITRNLYYVIVPISAGLAGAANFRSLMNLVLPALHVNWAASAVLVPMFVRDAKSGRTNGKIGLACGLMGINVLYGLGLIIWGNNLAQIMYGGTYTLDPQWFAIAAAIPVAEAVVAVYGASIRSDARPDLLFRAFSQAGALALLVGVPLMLALGVLGGIVAALVTVSTAALLIVMYDKGN